jgi:TldD protein
VTSLLLIWSLAVSPSDDVVRQAMSDEMGRTMKELQIPNEPRPHRVVYAITDTELASAAATFGASMGVATRRWRTLRVEVRVGDRNFDSGNFVENVFSSDFPTPLPREDDPLALRRELWLRTDEAFKRAVDAIGKKRAAEKAQSKSAEEAPFDFADAKPAQGSSGEAGDKLDPDGLAKVASALSLIFRDYPGIHSSMAGGEHVLVRQRLLTSDGSWKDERRAYAELAVNAETQADDGMRLWSWSTFQGTSIQGLPPLAEMTRTVKAMAADLTAARKAPIPDNGSAVVLFEDRAAGQLMRRILGDHLSGTPPPRVAAGVRSVVPANDLASRLGQRIAPPYLEVYDDPRQPGPGNVPLFGSYQIDDEGVAAERVDLVKKGVLESLLMSRTPRKEITRSNGHGRGRSAGGAVRGRVGVLYLSGGKAALADAALRARAVKEARAAGKDVPVYIVRRLDAATGAGGEGRVRPLIVVRLRDGKEEPVRGITFQDLLPRSLKDLVAVGRQPFVYNYLTSQEAAPSPGGAPGTIVTPSVVFKDVEVKKDTDKHPRPPLYPHPAFAEK